MEQIRKSDWLLAAAMITLPAAFACGQNVAEGAAAEQDAPAAQVSALDSFREDFSYSIGLGFESMYVSSGNQAAYATFVPEVGLEYKGFYVGLVGFLPLNSNDKYFNEYDLSAGYAIDIEDIVTVSLGGTYYMYPDSGSDIRQTRELNFELSVNTLLTPTLAINYDFDLEQFEVILGISHEFDLAELVGIEGLSVNTAFWYGYVQANNVEATSSNKEKDGYGYIEANANIVYAANETVSLYVGPRIAYNNNGKHMNMNENETKIWVGTGAVWSF